MDNKPYIYDKEAGLETIRDPMIALINGRYYLTGTQPPYWEGPNDGVRLWSSDDLEHWTSHGVVVKRADMPESMWCRERFWAPEIFDGKDGYYYLTFNCRNDTEKYKYMHSTGIARATKPEGPYEIMTKDKSLVDGILPDSNDASLFRDGDNIYLFTNQIQAIYMFRLDTKDFTLHDKKVVIEKTNNNEWDSIGVEGPCVVKRHGIYFMWYSSWTHKYAAGIATTTSLYGEWKKLESNPVLSESDIWYNGGHNNCFTGKDGKDYVTFHAQCKDPSDGNIERFFIRPVEYYADGTVKVF